MARSRARSRPGGRRRLAALLLAAAVGLAAFAALRSCDGGTDRPGSGPATTGAGAGVTTTIDEVHR